MGADPRELGLAGRYFDLPGLRLHAAVTGPERGPLVVLLHGFPECWLSWRHQFQPLAEAGFRVVAPDLRGHNLTGKRPPYDLATVTQDIVHLLDAFGADRAHVAGHDWGGAVAWCLAEHYPDRLATVTIINIPHPHVAVRSVLRGNWRQALRSSYVVFNQLPWIPEWLLSRNRFAVLRRALQATSNPGTFSDADLERYQRAWAEPGALTAMLGWYRAFMRRVVRRLGRFPPPPPITVPGLLLWGERDPALGIELAERSARLLPPGQLHRFPEATHWLHQELPHSVNAHLLAHFAGAM